MGVVVWGRGWGWGWGGWGYGGRWGYGVCMDRGMGCGIVCLQKPSGAKTFKNVSGEGFLKVLGGRGRVF